METTFIGITPVLPSSNIVRDINWYKVNLGFECIYTEKEYAVLKRKNLHLHLQWHANNENDPLLGGSVVKIFVENISNIYNELLKNGVIKTNNYNSPTSWNTKEIGLFDLNRNAIFFVENL